MEHPGLNSYVMYGYDSKLQQWPTVDPLAEKDPGISPYVYCRDNPVRYVDPDGKKYIKEKYR